MWCRYPGAQNFHRNLSPTISEINTFYAVIQDGDQKGSKMILGKLANRTCRYSAGQKFSQNMPFTQKFSQNMHFTQKFKMAKMAGNCKFNK